jgi:hypothetical protein
MAHRRIVDENEHVWDVWEVKTSTSTTRRIQVPAELQAGWLAFQCGEERRRLAPLPIGWNEMSDRALLELMARAKPSRPGIRTS